MAVLGAMWRNSVVRISARVLVEIVTDLVE